MTPVPDRAKAIEAMARAMYEATTGGPHATSWDSISVQESYRDDARAALAALEAEGWGLACTREAEKPCADCGGSGEQVAYTLDADHVARDIHRTCPSCGGSGHATKGTGR